MNLQDANTPAPGPDNQPGQETAPATAGGQRYVVVKMPPTKPYVTYAFMGFTILVYLLQLGSKFFLGGDYPAALGLKANDAILQGELWRLFTPMFLHSTSSLLHIGFNMYALYALGPELERHFGHLRYLALYLLSGFAGNVASFLLSPEYSLGASTAVFGLIGAQGAFLYHNRSLFGRIAQRALVNILVVAGINLFIGLSPGIDNWGHVGGLVGGTLFALFGGPLLQVEAEMGALKLSDRREPGAWVAAGLGVGLLFAALAAVKFFLSGG